MRIISLIASSTEIVCALGQEKNLVGRSHECDYPQSVMRLPVCSEPNFDIEGSSGVIDERVKNLVKAGQPLYRIKSDVMQSLKPDVIVTQDHCEVCAVSLKDVEDAVCRWGGHEPRIVALKPDSLADVWSGIEKVAEAVNAADAGKRLIRTYRQRMEAMSRQSASAPSRPRVACIEWLNPLMAAGNWVPELTALLHADCVFGQAGKHSPWMSWEELCAQDPDVMIMMPCGWDMAKCEQEMKVLTERPDWNALKAVRDQRVYLTDGNQYFNRPGPRLVESMEILAEILYPAVFRFGFEGNAWRRF